MTIVVLGTHTDVGKTWLTVELTRRLRARGLKVAIRKPVQSYEPGNESATDADLLAAATDEQPEHVCPRHRWLPVPMAPPIAADALGLPPIHAADLLDELRWPRATSVRLIETVGGVYSPLAHDIDSAGFAHLVGAAQAILVADAGLGTINAIRASLAALTAIPVLVHLNRYDPSDDLHRRNRAWLEEQHAIATTTTPDELCMSAQLIEHS